MSTATPVSSYILTLGGGVIEGQVTSNNGKSVAGLRVRLVYNSTGKDVPHALTTVGTLGPNGYRSPAFAPAPTTSRSGPAPSPTSSTVTHHRRCGTHRSWSSPTREILNGVDAVMETGGTLTGTVTGGAQPADGQTVRAYLVGTSYVTQTEIESGPVLLRRPDPRRLLPPLRRRSRLVWNGDTKDKALVYHGRSAPHDNRHRQRHARSLSVR